MMEPSRPDQISDEKIIKENIENLKMRVSRLHDDQVEVGACIHLGDFLQGIYGLREVLDQLEQGLLQHHLNCCLSPRIKIPAEVVLALAKLKAKRHGAIIVIEQNDDVEKNLIGGINLNAPVNAAILENIFYPGSPLHDGAVIIRESIIAKANTILPLAPQDARLANLALGTRHRAALGLSQVSDALVIVASEERGWISVALGGEIYPNLGSFGLLAKLENHKREQA